MRLKQLVKLCLGLLRHPIYTAWITRSQSNEEGPDLLTSMLLAANWLLKAQQKAPDGQGYSRSYSLIFGWDRCYIETTGYIIPTLLDVGRDLGVARYRQSAFKAAEWLLSVQTPEGAFTDIKYYKPYVFDTGQVLLGLNRMFRETEDERYLDALYKAGRWLMETQEEDGSWVRFAYNNQPHSYYSRVGAALIEAGQLANIDEFIEAGERNLQWTASQRQPNGYFAHSAFRPKEDALLHTIVYVLEGFIMAYGLTGESRWRDIAIEGAATLASLQTGQGLLYSQYSPQWTATNQEFCVTGLAQYAGLCLDVSAVTGDDHFKNCGLNVLNHLCWWQVHRGDDILGALPSSIPFWGYYGGMEFYNWNVKFFLDAALKAFSKNQYD